MNDLKQKIEMAFDSIDINIPEDNRMIINISKDGVISILSYLKNAGYEHLALISCVDLINENEFELVYIVSAYMKRDDEFHDREKQNIIIKTRISREKTRFMTVINIFENAEPYEREIYELFGINFQGHPRLKPLFLEIEYEMPPFRKNFDTRKFVDDMFGNIPEIEGH